MTTVALLNEENKERCVLCGKLLSYDITLDIEFRQFYVTGCGQLCDVCYKKITEEMKCSSFNR